MTPAQTCILAPANDKDEVGIEEIGVGPQLVLLRRLIVALHQSNTMVWAVERGELGH
jgi:hypothetical protein